VTAEAVLLAANLTRASSVSIHLQSHLRHNRATQQVLIF